MEPAAVLVRGLRHARKRRLLGDHTVLVGTTTPVLVHLDVGGQAAHRSGVEVRVEDVLALPVLDSVEWSNLGGSLKPV